MDTTKDDVKDEVAKASDEVAKASDEVAEASDEVVAATQDGAAGATQKAREVVSDAAGAARSAVESAAPAVRDAAEAARSAVQSHAPAVLEAGRSTAGKGYEQVRQAPDEQLAIGTAFAAGLMTGFVLARVPRPLLLLALVPLGVLGGTLLGRRVPFIGKAMGSPAEEPAPRATTRKASRAS